MPEGVRRGGELQRGVFQILIDQPQGLPAREVLARLADSVPPTKFESDFYPKHPGVRRYEHIVRFLTIGTVKAGWLVKDEGQWSLTEDGIAAFKKFRDPGAFHDEVKRLYRKWKDEQPTKGPDEDEGLETLAPSAALEQAEEAALAEIHDRISKMHSHEVQKLVAALLEGMGYHPTFISEPNRADGGLDIIAYRDHLGTTGPRLKGQVKRTEKAVDPGTVREFLSLLGENDVGLLVSTGGFTGPAEIEALKAPQRLLLFDAKRIHDLWVEHYSSIPEAKRRLLPLKAVHFLLPEE